MSASTKSIVAAIRVHLDTATEPKRERSVRSNVQQAPSVQISPAHVGEFEHCCRLKGRVRLVSDLIDSTGNCSGLIFIRLTFV
jgi:hypothetical protein